MFLNISPGVYISLNLNNSLNLLEMNPSFWVEMKNVRIHKLPQFTWTAVSSTHGPAAAPWTPSTQDSMGWEDQVHIDGAML
jgi:hypothetical protein